ncbi:hypothetical protein DY252_04745 [Thalassospira indica]|uniref:Uncharacterized protein n=1 Tax=Thalassospira indica TaxID=1891279 RepID=A0ABN5ND80_9PROT|nr:hypothetical protein DY252_04745 [Thalassospira indica]
MAIRDVRDYFFEIPLLGVLDGSHIFLDASCIVTPLHMVKIQKTEMPPMTKNRKRWRPLSVCAPNLGD